MDMSINLTLLVQIGNFIVAYAMLSYFFFRPGYSAVRLDEEYQRILRSKITAREELIAHKQEHKRSRWRLFQDYFTKQKPDLREKTNLAHDIAMRSPSFLTYEERLSLSKEVAQKLKEVL